MRDCIDRRVGDEGAFLCDDANQAYRSAHDRESWITARDAAIAVVSHYNQINPTKGAAWSEQAADCHRKAEAAS